MLHWILRNDPRPETSLLSANHEDTIKDVDERACIKIAVLTYALRVRHRGILRGRKPQGQTPKRRSNALG